MIVIRHLKQVIGELITFRFTLLIKSSNQPIGNIDVLDPLGEQPFIMNFFIDEKYRGLGYGKKLINQAEELVIQAGGDEIYLSVHPNNDIKNMYLLRGYEYTGVHTEHGESFMCKEL